MLMKLLEFIVSGYVLTLKLDPEYINSLPDIRSFISSSGVHYYLCGDASSGVVVTTVSIHSE
jgi:hypothetical protein